MTQADLARALGVAQATVSRWESGQHEPTRDQWQLIMTLAAPHHDVSDWSMLFMVRTSRCPLILTTLDLTVVEASDAAIADDAMCRREFLGRSLRPQFDDALNAAFCLAQDRGLFAGEAIGVIITGLLRRLDGTLTPHISTWTPLRRSDGTPLLLWQRQLVSQRELLESGIPAGAQVLTVEDMFSQTLT
jgi:transcriptional regulator with XRE-family HTH domain